MTDPTDAPDTDSLGEKPLSDEPPEGLKAVKNAADLALTEVLEALREVAREKTGGRLTFSEIRFQFEAFIDEPNDDMMSAYENAWRACTETAQEAVWQKERKLPLERLVVSRFEHLFPPRGTAARQGEHLSRRIIGPFMFALQQLLGPDLHDEYEVKCRELVEDLRQTHGESFRWDMVTDHPEADNVTNDVLVHASQHFGDLERRRHWMVDLIDGNMAATNDAVEQPWRFEDREFHMLMNGLFGDLPQQLADPEVMNAWKQRYDEASLVGMVALLEKLAQ
ncbi:MAG: hypothetical protein CMM48_14040 [Rhodospirillaceae bacterium]|nr:hypothetical protein [Rhodospirillaceae bacterium]HAA92916.1 hypothetical protein [Rhodospirillaceae bacterium]